MLYDVVSRLCDNCCSHIHFVDDIIATSVIIVVTCILTSVLQ